MCRRPAAPSSKRAPHVHAFARVCVRASLCVDTVGGGVSAGRRAGVESGEGEGGGERRTVHAHARSTGAARVCVLGCACVWEERREGRPPLRPCVHFNGGAVAASPSFLCFTVACGFLQRESGRTRRGGGAACDTYACRSGSTRRGSGDRLRDSSTPDRCPRASSRVCVKGRRTSRGERATGGAVCVRGEGGTSVCAAVRADTVNSGEKPRLVCTCGCTRYAPSRRRTADAATATTRAGRPAHPCRRAARPASAPCQCLGAVFSCVAAVVSLSFSSPAA